VSVCVEGDGMCGRVRGGVCEEAMCVAEGEEVCVLKQMGVCVEGAGVCSEGCWEVCVEGAGVRSEGWRR